MTAVSVEILPRPVVDEESATFVIEEPTSLVVVEDIEALTEGATPGCNDDNPYR
ncbi:hypothetical protein ABZ819_23985 [Streptomyces venezuelae]|uniref:hypothetical protein n=1 Tax=Streptomyces venezuelae TaxID=54571 RepID=UPI0034307CCC